ncbi:hypothetical protein QQS21_007382 [Conoideocrella luteorostrata]|uniref:Uncharacterized protein n=1 Tax=Conoideocrella luteorostrata TaxID=1105319 RepID=A0AAJ0FXE6_9HYPO|nr:hypothetical protein QQS21_007382 [Conoideocrella luteorostrata]
MSTPSPLASLLKTIFIPAVISLILFLFLTFAVLPIWRRYRNRYSQYLPVDTISNHTSGLRHRVIPQFSRWTLPSTWSRNRGAVDNASADDYLEDGEELGHLDADTLDAINRHIMSAVRDSTRRLSRE